MQKKINTVDLLNHDNISNFDEEYEYQKDLTAELDKLNSDFNQDIINEIVLWKVNRYVKISDETLHLINEIDQNDTTINIELTKKVLRELLNIKGIRIPMASTILRFRNPKIYQIIDQRVFRFIHPEGEELKDSKDNEVTIQMYLDYLKRLNEVCLETGIPYEESDRKLYLIDKKFNTEFKLR